MSQKKRLKRKMKQVIEVTQKHINKGCKDEPYRCPVALAIKDKTQEGIAVYNNSFSDGIYGPLHNEYKYPRSVRRFVAKFDALGKKAVKPFRFILEKIG